MESAFDIRIKTNYDMKCNIATKAAEYLKGITQSGQAHSIFMGGGQLVLPSLNVVGFTAEKTESEAEE